MKLILVSLIACVLLMLILYMLGKRDWEKNIALLYCGKKDYLGADLCPIGFGLMRVLPFIKKIRVSSLYYIFSSRYDDKEEINAHWYMVISQLITFFFVGLSFLLFFAYALSTSSGFSSKKEAFLVFAFVPVFFEVYIVNSVRKKDRIRIEKIVDDLPELLNQLVIMLNSGVTIAMAFTKLGSIKGNRPLDEEIQKVILDFSNHGDIVCALGRMQRRCHCAQVSRLCSIVDHSANKGAAGANSALANLALELWEEKRHNVKKKGTTLGTKLMLPTILLFVIVIIYSTVPVFFSLRDVRI